MKRLSILTVLVSLACLPCWRVTANDRVYVQRPTQADASDQARQPKLKKVPESLLLTERGRELAFQWRRLNASVQTMGPKHPSRAALTDQLLKVEQELLAIEPALGQREPNPFRSRLRSLVDPSVEAPESADPADASDLKEGDVQQLRRQMAALMKRLEQLEERVAELKAARR